MILCVTPNPAIDRTLHVNSLRLGEVHRAEKVLAMAGGKGLNVARTIRALGGTPICMGLIGGHTGDLLAELTTREGLAAHWTRIKNETRTCVILVERGRDATLVNEPGAEVDAGECQSFIADVWENASRAALICSSGSLPPGFSEGLFRILLNGLVERKKSVWVDTSGMALKAALDTPGVNIKVNAVELGEALGMEISSVKHAASAVRELSKSRSRQIVLTLGADGAVFADAEQTHAWLAQAPQVDVVSSVGSGDAFLGGLAFALDAGNPPEIALRHAVAAGTANALHFGGGLLSRAEFDELYGAVSVVDLEL